MDVLLALKPATQISDQTILVFDVHFRCLAAETDSTFLDQARDIASCGIGHAGHTGRILRRQGAYQAGRQGCHVYRAATCRRLRDTAAKGALLLWRLLGKGAAQRVCRASALTAYAG
jgi:hypothetical protein